MIISGLTQNIRSMSPGEVLPHAWHGRYSSKTNTSSEACLFQHLPLRSGECATQSLPRREDSWHLEVSQLPSPSESLAGVQRAALRILSVMGGFAVALALHSLRTPCIVRAVVRLECCQESFTRLWSLSVPCV